MNRRCILLILLLLFCIGGVHSQTSYDWTGSASTDWNNSDNWNPRGVPTSSDNVTIVSSSNDPVLGGNAEVKDFTMTSGVLDLKSNTLHVYGQAYIQTGHVHDGLLDIQNESKADFIGSTLECVMNVHTPSFTFRECYVRDQVSIFKYGESVDESIGGNVFDGPVEITCDTKEGIIVMSASDLSDVFNNTLTLDCKYGQIYMSHYGHANEFHGLVTLKGRDITFNSYGTSSFYDDIAFQGINGNITFGGGEGNATLYDSKNIYIVPESSFEYSNLSFYNFNQRGQREIILNLGRNSSIHFEHGSNFDANLYIYAPEIYFNDVNFNGPIYFQQTGNLNCISQGGNTFNSSAIFVNSGIGTFTFGNDLNDTYNGYVTFQNIYGKFVISKSIFNNAVYVENLYQTNSDYVFNFSKTGNCEFKSSLSLHSIKAGIQFGPEAMTSLSTNGSLNVTNNYIGNISLQNFNQLNTTPTTLQINSNSALLIIGNNSIFRGVFSYTGPSINLNGATFYERADITKTISTNDICAGGNSFYGIANITDNASGTHSLKLANSGSDTFYGNVTFTQAGGASIFPNYTKDCYYKANVTISSSGSNIIFGGNNGRSIFDGTISQAIASTGSSGPEFKELEINKATGNVNLINEIIIVDTFKLVKGIVIPGTNSAVRFKSTCNVTDGSNDSFIEGPTIREGGGNYLMPIGSSSGNTQGYHPLSIVAPVAPGLVLKAQYYSLGHNLLNSTVDADIGNCDYWTLTQLSQGQTTQVRVELGWNGNSCKKQNLLVVVHNGIGWADLGGNTTTTSFGGKTLSAGSVNIPTTVYRFTLAQSIMSTYTSLQRELDGSYINTKNRKLYFNYYGEYGNSNSTPLNYKIYAFDRHVINNCGNMVKKYGDNRYELDLATNCGGSFTIGKIYLLEVSDEKNEKYYLKFKY